VFERQATVEVLRTIRWMGNASISVCQDKRKMTRKKRSLSRHALELNKSSVARLLLFVVLTIHLASHFDVITFRASSLIHCDDTLHMGGMFETSKPFGSLLIPSLQK